MILDINEFFEAREKLGKRTLTLSESNINQIENISKKSGISLSQIIDIIIYCYFQTLEDGIKIKPIKIKWDNIFLKDGKSKK